MSPRSCPICNHPNLRRLLEDVQISAAVTGDIRKVSGVAAFICEIAGHIFFVRISDLDQELSVVRSVPDGDHSLH